MTRGWLRFAVPSCWLVGALGLACSEPVRDVTDVTVAPGPDGSAPASEKNTREPAVNAALGSLLAPRSPVELSPDAVWDGRWPLPAIAMPHHSRAPGGFSDSAQVCTDARGEPGITVNGKECHNPCPARTAPVTWNQCAAICRTDADCTRGGRRGSCSIRVGNAMLCDRPATLECPGSALSEPCTVATGEPGQQCPGTTECVFAHLACRDGQTSVGFFLGQSCAKTCRSDADCPGGSCTRESHQPKSRPAECGPSCPGAGCPIPWD